MTHKSENHTLDSSPQQNVTGLEEEAAAEVENGRHSPHTHVSHKKNKKSHQKQIDLQTQLAQITATVPGLICSFLQRPDGAMSMPYASPALSDVYGLDGAKLAQDATPLFKIIHPKDIQQVTESIAESARTLTRWHHEYRILHPQKGEIWLEGNSMPQRQPDGSILWHGFVQDVTSRKQAENAYRESEEKLRLFIKHAPASLAMFDQDMRYLAHSRRWVIDYRLEDQALIGRSHYEVFPEITERWKGIHQRALRGEVVRTDKDPFLRADGTMQWLQWEIRPWYTADGPIGGIVIFTEDITERKQAENALRESEERYHSALDNMLEGCQIIGFDWRYLYLNASVTEHSRRRKEELLGRTMMEAYPGIENTELFTILNRCLTERTAHRLENKFEYADGSSAWFDLSVQPIPEGLFILSIDITERKRAAEEQTRLEEQLRQAQKMESIGRLAGGVAHDFNNQLTIMQIYGDLMRAEMGRDHPLLPKLEHIRRASEHAASLTRQLLAFSRKQILQPVVINLNNLVANLQNMLARLIGEDILLSTVLQPELWSVTADPGQIEQVIMNLIINARDAMPTGGMLTLETSNIILDESITSTHLDAPLGPCVMLAVTDTGHGMDKATLKHIFEPFFTTKQSGQGTGLGLATVHGIVKQSGGAIFVYSELHKGTTFKVCLPASDSVIDQLATSATGKMMQQGSETVLLVEDEEELRALVRLTLEELGYTVLVAGDASQALDQAEQCQGAIDLLLTDVVMPQKSGRELSEELYTLRPEMKVLFTSGYMDDAVVRHGLLTAEVNFLPKPFTRSSLAAKVREVLDQ